MRKFYRSWANTEYNEALEKELKKLKRGLECPKDFQCCKEGLENLCKAKDIGMEEYVECLEEHAHSCTFSVPFGSSSFFCHCPLRVHIAKSSGK